MTIEERTGLSADLLLTQIIQLENSIVETCRENSESESIKFQVEILEKLRREYARLKASDCYAPV